MSDQIQLTAVLNFMAQNPDLAGPVVGVIFIDEYFDTGDRISYHKSTVQLALKRKDIDDEVGAWLADLVVSSQARP